MIDDRPTTEEGWAELRAFNNEKSRLDSIDHWLKRRVACVERRNSAIAAGKRWRVRAEERELVRLDARLARSGHIVGSD
jgi:hypothetical protein